MASRPIRVRFNRAAQSIVTEVLHRRLTRQRAPELEICQLTGKLGQDFFKTHVGPLRTFFAPESRLM